MIEVLHININFSKTMISVGQSNGYELYRYQDLQKTSSKIYDGGIGPIDVLETSNIICLSGGGFFPNFQKDNVIILDDCNEQIRAQIQLPSQVRKLKFFKQFLIAVLDYKVFILNFFSQIQVLKVINTSLNLKGMIDYNVFNNKYQIATINNIYSDNNTLISNIQILDCLTLSQKNIEVGHTELYQIKLSESKIDKDNKQNWIASVARDSDEIQIFDINTGQKLKKCDFKQQSIISSMAFDSSGQYFAVLYKQKQKQEFKLEVYTFEQCKKQRAKTSTSISTQIFRPQA